MAKYILKAYVLAIVKRGTEHEVAEKILQYDNVTEALGTYGMWDLVARIEAENPEKLDKIISNIRQLPEIESTNTLIGV